MSDVLSGQVAIVTGGGRGVGLGIVEALAGQGMSIAVVGRSAGEIESAAATVTARNVPALAVAADVTDWSSVAEMVARVEHKLGPVDLLVNNAGRAHAIGPPWELDPDDWWRDVEVNLRGTFLASRAVLPSMVARGSGRIVNVATLAAAQPYPYASGYASSKAAVLRFTDSLAAASAEHGICTFAISPGLVRTHLLDDMANSAAAKKWLPEFQSRDDYVPSSAAGALVAALASGIADSLSGRFIHVSDDLVTLVAQAERIVERNLRQLCLPMSD